MTKEDNDRYLASLVHEINKDCQRHQIIFSATGQAFHQCTVCFEVLPRCWDNWEHQRRKHTENDVHAAIGFQCEGCSQLFKTQKTLQRHSSHTCLALLQNISDIMSMKNRCELCFRLLPSEKRWKKHLEVCRLSIGSKSSSTTATTC